MYICRFPIIQPEIFMMNQIVTLHDKDFEVYISQDQINTRIDELAEQIDKDYENKMITMIGNLTGAFIIMADLCRHLKTPVDVKFVKYSSYSGMESTHVVKERMGFGGMDLTGRDVLIVEDIIDTGLTLDYLLNLMQYKGAATVKVFSLLNKPDAIQKDVTVDYIGFDIPNDFVVGYGLDYDGMGRDLNAIYKLKE